MKSISHKPAWELATLIAKKEISPLELMKETLDRIERINPVLNAFIALRSEEALAEASIMTDAITSGKATGPLAGIPLGVKDLEDTTGMVTSYGSIPFKNNMATKDSIFQQNSSRSSVLYKLQFLSCNGTADQDGL